MDPSDLRAGMAERLASSEPIDAETFNAACFMLSRALEGIGFTVPEAAPLARRLLRGAGRVVIDMGSAGSASETSSNRDARSRAGGDRIHGPGSRFVGAATPARGRPCCHRHGHSWVGIRDMVQHR